MRSSPSRRRGSVGYHVVALYDDDPATWGSDVLGVRVSGAPSASLAGEAGALFVAIGQAEARRRLAEHLGDAATWATLVHPRACVDAAASIGAGALVCAGAVVQPEACVGAHAIVNTAASVDHHAVVGAFAHVGPGARLNGYAHLGEAALLGSGAVVLPGIRIGEGAVVGAGSVVLQDIAQGMRVAGVPARVLDSDRVLAPASSARL